MANWKQHACIIQNYTLLQKPAASLFIISTCNVKLNVDSIRIHNFCYVTPLQGFGITHCSHCVQGELVYRLSKAPYVLQCSNSIMKNTDIVKVKL